MNDVNDSNTAIGQARAQYETLCSMLAACAVDYGRLDELRDQAADEPLEGDELQELADLEEAAGDCSDADDAEQRIQEDPLAIDFRSDWVSKPSEMEPAEFAILLCTGGPAVRIRGELDRGQPVRAWLEYQDWGTPWTQYFDADSDRLCEYASRFYYGE